MLSGPNGCYGRFTGRTVYTSCGSVPGWEEVPGKGAPPLPSPATDADISGVALADLDGDTYDDLLVLTYAGYPSQVYLNPGDGDFSNVIPARIGLSTETGHATAVAAKDLNNDGIMDLVVTYEGEYNMMYLAATPGDFSGVSGVAFGSMDGTSVDVKIGDIDGDGAPDIAVATDGAPNVVFFGDASLAVGGTPAYATLGQNAPTPGTHSPGTASGPWGYSTIGPLSEATTGLELGDVDNDGDLDVAVMNQPAGASTSMLHATDPSYNTPMTRRSMLAFLTGCPLDIISYSSVNFVDVHNEGQPDLMVVSPNGVVHTILNNNDGSGAKCYFALTGPPPPPSFVVPLPLSFGTPWDIMGP